MQALISFLSGVGGDKSVDDTWESGVYRATAYIS
jgi:hypothetical protein